MAAEREVWVQDMMGGAAHQGHQAACMKLTQVLGQLVAGGGEVGQERCRGRGAATMAGGS